MAVAIRSPVVQVTNVCPTATSEQLKTLFGHIGTLQDFVIYPSDEREELASKVAFVKYEDPLNAEVALHLNNTVFLDRALIVLPLADGKENIPDEKHANLLKAPANTAAGVLPRTADWPLDVISMVVGRPGEQIIHTIEPRLSNLAFPLYPPLPATTDGSRIEEIRRTILVTNLEPKTTGDQVLEFFNEHAEVRCVRMAGTEYDRAAYVEFTHQPSIIKAFGVMGATLNNRQIMVQHSSCAIIKPANNVALFDEAAKLAAAKAAAAAVGEGKSDDRRRSRSRSRGRRSRSRRRSASRNYNPRSRDRRRSRSRKARVKRSRTRSRSRGRKRYSPSRSRDRRRDGRSRSRRRNRSGSRTVKRFSRSRSKGRRDRREREKERVPDRVSRDKNHDRDRRDKDRERARDKSRKEEKSRRHRDTSPKASHHSTSNTENVGKAEDAERKSTVASEAVTVAVNSEPRPKPELKSENDTSGSDSNSECEDQQPSLNGISNGSEAQDADLPDSRVSSKPTVVGVKLAGPEDMDNLSPQKTSSQKHTDLSGDSGGSSDDAMDTET